MSQMSQVQFGLPFPIPHITETDLRSFHIAHFGEASSIAFTTEFLGADNAQMNAEVHHGEDGVDAYYEDEEDDEDGLGYYPDGVKRTLTDEQIAMFRHSETQALQRERERASTRRNTSSPSPTPAPMDDLKDGGGEDGELLDSISKTGGVATNRKKRNKKKKRGSGNGSGKRQYSPDPERRKRTWDVVETGLDGLDYGESGPSQHHPSPTRQRRRITYDDG
ncbi:hypothetical protein Daus18300_000669 [Diaporthe australafricana]|uniref:Uncharacterized protein n=1 Tax=Diaporthe australafricana TaxID=127596 RepID=A0ABR3Y290_9PEZI